MQPTARQQAAGGTFDPAYLNYNHGQTDDSNCAPIDRHAWRQASVATVS